MKELVVLSGKGGTGKTSIVASFAALYESKVVADCDVDAADLHLVLNPRLSKWRTFSGSKLALVDRDVCTGCGRCIELCRFDAIKRESNAEDPLRPKCVVDPLACEGCGACVIVCPAGATSLGDAATGEWAISKSRLGPLVHARLGIGQESSGKLVTVVRTQAAALARELGSSLSLIDGSPGIGCPVIASLTGADLALVVTEPTVSGLHDLQRVAGVAKKLRVPAVVSVNKHDLNPDTATRIEDWCSESGIPVAPLIPYDDAVTDAQVNGLSVVEHSDGPAATAIKELWRSVREQIGL
ncbi:MAG TPA: ATP-binding protein [bacterium]|nr:ATP-binding protein [bacterium]